MPTRYYLELRLERARQLLLQTSMPIVDIARACGFISAPHFSKCYRDRFSLPPRDERRRAAGLLDARAAPAPADELPDELPDGPPDELLDDQTSESSASS